jgi:hypothetical protein
MSVRPDARQSTPGVTVPVTGRSEVRLPGLAACLSAALLLAGWALAPSASAATPPYLQITGNAASSMAGPLPGLGGQGEFDWTAPSGTLGDGVVVDGGPIGGPTYAGGQAVASAAFGRLGVLAGAEVIGPPLAFPNNELSANGSAMAVWSDIVTVVPTDPALLFTHGLFSFEVQAGGSGGATQGAHLGFGSAHYIVTVQVGGAMCPTTCSFRRFGYWNETLAGMGGDPLPLSIAADVDIIIGSPFTLSVSLSADASVFTGDERVEAHSNILHTALWNGITSMKDANGNEFAHEVQSLSGTNWSLPYAAPVPEPATWFTLLAGLALMGASGSLRRR